MASNSSGPLSPGESYTLGQYTFSIGSQYDSESDTTYISADCSYGEDSGVKQTTVEREAEIVSWEVEVSDDAADIYATIRRREDEETMRSEIMPEWAPDGVNCASTGTFVSRRTYKSSKKWYFYTHTWECEAVAHVLFDASPSCRTICASSSPGTFHYERFNTHEDGRTDDFYEDDVWLEREYTYNDKTVYYSLRGRDTSGAQELTPLNNAQSFPVSDDGKAAWTMIYGTDVDPKYEEETVFVARFKIVPEDADPEDWDDPIDDGDPELVLKVTVRGALSGRHNDPIYDTSYSYTPADNPAVKDYGCGGDGGYGGGGGAGASTVIINKFSTSQAGSHETYAYARRHGYGSGGGKGGRGGDGCIIIYW